MTTKAAERRSAKLVTDVAEHILRTWEGESPPGKFMGNADGTSYTAEMVDGGVLLILDSPKGDRVGVRIASLDSLLSQYEPRHGRQS